MATFQPTAAPSNWGVERGKLDGNFQITNQLKLVLQSQNDVSQFLANGIGDVQPINYGTPSVVETAYLTFDGMTATFVTPGLYVAFLKAQIGRTASPGTSTIATRSVYTPNGGSAQYTAPRLTELDDSNTSLGLTRTNLVSVGAGDTFSNEFVKDSGETTVQLQADVLTTAGWGTSPSASISVYKMNENGTPGLMGF